jgi:predicted Holliday junction resolvase-like endonuclease
MYILIAFLIFLIAYCEYKYNVLNDKYTELEVSIDKQIKEARTESVKQSKAVIRGKVSEEFIPLFPDFPYNLSDCKFSGQPLDYIIFNGMSDVRDGDGKNIEIIFADVKVNTSTKSKVQLAIEKAIKDGNVRFETWNIKDNKIIIK